MKKFEVIKIKGVPMVRIDDEGIHRLPACSIGNFFRILNYINERKSAKQD